MALLARNVWRLTPRWRALAFPTRDFCAPTSTQPSPATTTTTTPVQPPAFNLSSDQPHWAGGDVEAVMHKSLDDMVPIDLVSLPGKIFNAPVRPDIVHQVVVWQLARRRAGTAKTKNRSEVAASGRKIRPQKGSGRSRQGARSSPIFRGGGRAHGPVPRNFDYPLPNSVRINGLRSVLSSKLANGQLWLVDSAEIADSKTKAFIDCIDKVGWPSVLVVDDNSDGIDGVTRSLYFSSRGVFKAMATNPTDLNVYDSLNHDMLVLTSAALQGIQHRFAKHKHLY